MGQSEDGTIYIAVSNHDEDEGNVAVFALDPVSKRMRFVNDLRTVSTIAGNWMEGESQYKVHTFLRQHADGLLYFATMPASDPSGRRGAHLYTLDPATDVITDISASAPQTLRADGTTADGTGVAAEAQGIKGIGLHPDVPGVLYGMTHDKGHLFRLMLDTGEMETIGRSARVSYVFHVDSAGDVYYLGGEPGAPQSLFRYDAATGATTSLAGGFDKNEEIGMIAPTANPDVVMVLMARTKDVFPIHTGTERQLRGGTSCGKNGWRLFNMTVSPDGKHVYFVSNNNKRSKIWRAPVNGGRCEEVLNVNDLLGSRNLAFGGRNIWIGNSFYTPVWTHKGSNDLAILEVTVD